MREPCTASTRSSASSWRGSSASAGPREGYSMTTVEMLMSATCLTLLMLVMIEAVFIFW